MIKLRIAALVAILLGPSAAAYAARGWKVERTLPASLCAQSLLLVLLGYWLPFSVCVGIVAAISIVSWIWAFAHIGNVRRAAGFFSLPCLLFLIVVPILYRACARRFYLSYDEQAHWGLIVKLITLYDELPRAGRGAGMLLFTYPPAGAMLPAMASTLLPYRDGIAYFGYGLLTAGLMAGLLPENARGAQRLGGPLIYLCMMAIFPLSFLRLFSEPVIALLAALLIVGRGGERTAPDDWCDCLYAAMLAMMKNTGVAILALVLLVRLLTRREEGRRCLRMLLCAAVAVISYAVYCRVHGIQALASPSHLAQNLRALFAGTLPEAYRTAPQRLAQYFVTRRLPQGGVYSSYGFGTCTAVYGVVLLLCAAQTAAAQNRREALKTWAGVWAANALYVLLIAVSYVFFFEEREAAYLSEADRYLMLPALWTGLMACGTLLRDCAEERRTLRCAATVLATLCLLPLSHPEMTWRTFVTQEYVYSTIWERDVVEWQGAFLREELDGEEDAKLLCMGGYDHIPLRYVIAGSATMGGLPSSWPSATWQGSCDAVREELESGGYTHVFVGGLGDVQAHDQDAVDERYAPLTADGELLKRQSLYRVERDAEGGVTLVYVASVPDVSLSFTTAVPDWVTL